MLAQRRIYDHAPPEISIPVEFRNAALEVLFLRINEPEMQKTAAKEDPDEQMAGMLASQPVTLSALSLDTAGFSFNREEANAR